MQDAPPLPSPPLLRLRLSHRHARRYRTPYWNHKSLVDWTGGGHGFGVPLERVLFAPTQWLYHQGIKLCCAVATLGQKVDGALSPPPRYPPPLRHPSHTSLRRRCGRHLKAWRRPFAPAPLHSALRPSALVRRRTSPQTPSGVPSSLWRQEAARSPSDAAPAARLRPFRRSTATRSTRATTTSAPPTGATPTQTRAAAPRAAAERCRSHWWRVAAGRACRRAPST